MRPGDDELRYYRSVEDLFATLRGVPHVLSPKDFQLLRSWWRDQVPLSAVLTGIAEIFARRHERGDQEPIVSLGYCRHAVRRQAKRLAEMRVGSESAGVQGMAEQPPIGEALAALAARLQQVAAALDRDLQPAADAIAGTAQHLAAAADLPSAALDEYLYSLEAALLVSCWHALPEAARRRIEDETRRTAEASGATGEALERSMLALRDRELRSRLGLPRLELG